MARERQIEGGGDADMNFSDVELDEDGNPIETEEEEEEQEQELDEDGNPIEAGDRGDSVLDEDADLDALGAIAGEDSPTVPRARLSQVLEENRRLRGIVEQAATSRAGGEQRAVVEDTTPKFDLKAKLTERANAVLEGDIDKIVALDEEIETYRNTVVLKQGEQAGRQAATQAYQADRMNEIVNAAFKRYPFLNDDSAEFNKEALDDVLMYKQRYMAEGETQAAALKRAINRVCPHYAEDGGDGGDGEGNPRKPVKGEGKKPGANERDPRKIIRNAKAGNRMPPIVGRTGTGNAAARRSMTTRSATELGTGEYRDVPEAEKQRLRGDFVS